MAVLRQSSRVENGSRCHSVMVTRCSLETCAAIRRSYYARIDIEGFDRMVFLVPTRPPIRHLPRSRGLPATATAHSGPCRVGYGNSRSYGQVTRRQPCPPCSFGLIVFHGDCGACPQSIERSCSGPIQVGRLCFSFRLVGPSERLAGPLVIRRMKPRTLGGGSIAFIKERLGGEKVRIHAAA